MPAHQFYKCFGCGASGDVLKFVMEFEHVSFPEALKLLAERNGIPMPKRAEYADAETRLRAAVYQIQELAQEAFREQLAGPAGAEARRYLEKRGVSPGNERAIRAGIRRALRPRAAAAFWRSRGSPPSNWRTPVCWGGAKTAASTTVSATG